MSDPYDSHNDDETARRRDQVIKRMLNTPPQPHKRSPRVTKRKTGPAQKGRVHKAKSRS